MSSVQRISQFRDELEKFAVYIAEHTEAHSGYKAKGRLSIKGSITYLKLVFTIKLDGNTTKLKFPKSEQILEKSREFEKLFRVVLGRVVRVMLQTEKDYIAEYKGNGSVEFTQLVDEPATKVKNSGWWYKYQGTNDWVTHYQSNPEG